VLETLMYSLRGRRSARIDTEAGKGGSDAGPNWRKKPLQCFLI
jgi:hypothetical protein